MSSSGKQSPLGINVLGALLQNNGLTINPIAAGLMGSSTGISNYTKGTLITETCLNKLTDAIRLAYTSGFSGATYANLISIGSTTIPALGNAKSSEYTYTASTVGPLGDQPAWGGANYTGQTASYGYVRLFAWQAYDEFNFNSTLPEYRDFLNSITIAQSFINTNNSSIYAMSNSLTFLEGTYSNMNDLITADISGVSLATLDFGKDLINLGKSVDLSKIQTFGLPSNLLATLSKYNALTDAVSLALIGSGLEISDVTNILNGTLKATTAQELKMYQAFTIVLGQDLLDVLIPLNCKTKGLESLADLLNPKKMFPLSYPSLTVPVYNTTQVPTNSKTYFPIYTNGAVNSQLSAPNISSQIGTLTPPGAPASAPVTTSNNAISTFLALNESQRTEVLQMYQTYVDDPSNSWSGTQIKITKTSVTGGQERFPLDEYIKTIWYPVWGKSMNINTQSAVSDIINIQTPPIGFGSYLSGILPLDIAIAAGAFGITMQQIKNIMSVDFEKFALVVSNLETTKDLAVNGTDVPVNVSEVQASLALIALGSGPKGTYTSSDFYGCMSGLPYDWVKIKQLIKNIETPTLYTIYQNLYDAVVANDEPLTQTYINQANSEITTILANNAATAIDLNALWNITGKELTIEQRTRAAAIFPVPVPRDPYLTKNGATQSIFVDAVPIFALDTVPHGFAQTLEAISDLSTGGGRSLVAMMREARNQSRLNLVGIPLDNDISDTLSDAENKELVGNGLLPGTIPAVLNQDINGVVVSPKALGFYDPETDTYDSGYRQNEPLVPGSLADPDLPEIIPELDPVYCSDITLPSTMSVSEAIDDVIRCNCDCWDNI